MNGIILRIPTDEATVNQDCENCSDGNNNQAPEPAVEENENQTTESGPEQERRATMKKSNVTGKKLIDELPIGICYGSDFIQPGCFHGDDTISNGTFHS